MPKLYVTRVSAVTMSNSDGTVRQEIIKSCKVGESVILKHIPLPRRKKNIAVLCKNGQQIGNLDPHLAMFLLPHLEKGIIFRASIDHFNSAYDGTLIGVHICLILPDELYMAVSVPKHKAIEPSGDTQPANIEKVIRTKLVGVSAINEDNHKRQSIIRKYVKAGEILFLEHELYNSYDNNAIAVSVEPDDYVEYETKIGYLSRELAARLAPLMDSGYRIICTTLNKTGGKNGESFGVNVELTIISPEEQIQSKQEKEALQKTPVKAIKEQSTMESRQLKGPVIQPIQEQIKPGAPGDEPPAKKKSFLQWVSGKLKK